MHNFFSFFKNIWGTVYDDWCESDFGLFFLTTLFLVVINVFFIFLFNLTVFAESNVVTKNYILHKNITVNDYVCIDDDERGCYLKTSLGEIETTIKLNKKDVFDMGMEFGTCYHRLYFKIYTNDIVKPYKIIYAENFNKSSEEYKYYSHLYKIANTTCE